MCDFQRLQVSIMAHCSQPGCMFCRLEPRVRPPSSACVTYSAPVHHQHLDRLLKISSSFADKFMFGLFASVRDVAGRPKNLLVFGDISKTARQN